MPRYFFDIGDETDLMRDDEGSDLPDMLSAQREASGTLIEMARERFHMLMDATLRAEIRDESDNVVLRVQLTQTMSGR